MKKFHKTNSFKISNFEIGKPGTVFVIAEIGINHNGCIKTAKRLIDVAYVAGCNYVKFQKREPDLCVPEAQKNKLRDTPWGQMKYIDYKHKIEFGKGEFDELFSYAEQKGIGCFASVWDEPSVEFMAQYTDITKVPSALITNTLLCNRAREKNETLIISTGMSTEQEIEQCLEVFQQEIWIICMELANVCLETFLRINIHF